MGREGAVEILQMTEIAFLRQTSKHPVEMALVTRQKSMCAR
jgi:hypothetical protein